MLGHPDRRAGETNVGVVELVGRAADVKGGGARIDGAGRRDDRRQNRNSDQWASPDATDYEPVGRAMGRDGFEPSTDGL
jgi:hypothetical protein